jgi:ATP-dependent Clp protease ATP-binding subunit ClpA
VLIMTSNVGAAELSRRRPGFHDAGGPPDDDRAFERAFSPEFRNRLDARIAFAPLSLEVMERVVDRLLAEHAARLRARGVTLSVTPEARRWLAREGLDPLNGARPLARLVEERLLRPLSDALLFGALQEGGSASVSLGEEGITILFGT